MTKLNEDIAQLLINLKDRSFLTTTFPRILNVTKFGEEDLSDRTATLVFDEQVPKLTYVLPLALMREFKYKAENELWGAELRALTEIGETFLSKHTYFTGLTTEFGGPGDGARVFLEANQWQLMHDRPFVWVGQLSEKIPHSLGNLTLEIESRSSSGGHFYLKGDVYTYYLLRQKNTSLLVIENNSDDLNLDLIHRDLLIISFCVGFPISCKLLTALNQEGKIVGYAGSDFGFNKVQINAKQPPIPFRQNAFWFPELFEKITRKITEISLKDKLTNFLLDVIWLYVESTAETWYSSRELKLAYACLNAASCILYSAGGLDNAAAALAKNESENRKDALSSYFPDKLTSNFSLLLPTEIMQLAVWTAKLENADNLLESFKTSYLTLVNMQPEDLIAARDRQNKLITLCMELVAHFVQYTGPIQGWPADQVSEFARKEKVESEKVRYIAYIKAPMHVGDVTDLWPIFHEPIIPDNSLVELVNNFAKSLAPRTENRVKARLAPIPTLGEDQPKLFDFTVEVTQYPLAKNILFTIRQESNNSSLEIINWEEDVPAIFNEQQLIPFLTKVASSNRTKELIERLLLVSSNE